ncbi:MAG TPA: hypothetical protein VMV77_21935 [Bacteroidales bacterium]|nr:hypothetical protein [Bacteroidales bacterium]
MIARNYKKEEIKENPHKVDVRQLYNIMYPIAKAGRLDHIWPDKM